MMSSSATFEPRKKSLFSEETWELPPDSWAAEAQSQAQKPVPQSKIRSLDTCRVHSTLDSRLWQQRSWPKLAWKGDGN